MLRFIIADDHAVVRTGLNQLLLREFPQAFIKEVADADELIKLVMKEKWDVVISDIDMPGRSGLDALGQVKKISPALPVLMLSLHPEEQYATRALKAGASGYLSKHTLPEEFIKAVHKVLLGKKYVSAAIAEKLVNDLDDNSDKLPHERLSSREFEVMKLLAEGKANSDIADMLSLSNSTVSTHKQRLMEKMGLKSNSDLTKYAIENKLI